MAAVQTAPSRRRTVDGAALREGLRRDLPARIRATLKDYAAFASNPPEEEAKAFSAHHAACKAVLGHADMLVKLLKWAESDGGQETADGDAVGVLLARARAALGDDDGDGDGDGDGDNDDDDGTQEEGPQDDPTA
jgi:hypothetical protein